MTGNVVVDVQSMLFDFRKLQTFIDSTTTSLNHHTQRLDALEQDAKVKSARLERVEYNIGALSSSVESVKNALTSQSETIRRAEQNIQDLIADIRDTKFAATSVDAKLERAIGDIESCKITINFVQGSVNAFEKEAKAQDEEIRMLWKENSKIITDIGQLATSSSLSEMQQIMIGVRGDVVGCKDGIHQLGSRVDEVSSEVQEMSADIAKLSVQVTQLASRPVSAVPAGGVAASTAALSQSFALPSRANSRPPSAMTAQTSRPVSALTESAAAPESVSVRAAVDEEQVRKLLSDELRPYMDKWEAMSDKLESCWKRIYGGVGAVNDHDFSVKVGRDLSEVRESVGKNTNVVRTILATHKRFAYELDSLINRVKSIEDSPPPPPPTVPVPAITNQDEHRQAETAHVCMTCMRPANDGPPPLTEDEQFTMNRDENSAATSSHFPPNARCLSCMRPLDDPMVSASRPATANRSERIERPSSKLSVRQKLDKLELKRKAVAETKIKFGCLLLI